MLRPSSRPADTAKRKLDPAIMRLSAFSADAAEKLRNRRVGFSASAVVDDMVRAFETTSGHLSLRLLAALEAGQAAGGDTRGMQSAAMLIVQKDGGVWLHNDVVLRLHVDDNPEPIAELHRLVEKASEHRAMSRGYWQEMEAKAKARPKK